MVRWAVTVALLHPGAQIAWASPAASATSDGGKAADSFARPATVKVTFSPAGPPPGRHDGPPIPGWIPALGIGLTTSLLAGAMASGVLARGQWQELDRTCGMTDGGCTPAQIADARSWARIANVLWLATAVVGSGTALAVYVDARSVGFSRTWSF